MEKEAPKKVLADVQRAQAKIARAEGALDSAREDRRDSFKRARSAGLSLGEIAKAANLHRSRVDQILRGK
jgi:DNA-directed RNA polymerase specialized sigma24 family protein